MREQISLSRSWDPDWQEIRTKLSSLIKSGIDDPGLCLCEYRLRRITMSVTAAINSNETNWGRTGGCLGFLVYLFSGYNGLTPRSGLLTPIHNLSSFFLRWNWNPFQMSSLKWNTVSVVMFTNIVFVLFDSRILTKDVSSWPELP